MVLWGHAMLLNQLVQNFPRRRVCSNTFVEVRDVDALLAENRRASASLATSVRIIHRRRRECLKLKTESGAHSRQAVGAVKAVGEHGRPAGTHAAGPKRHRLHNGQQLRWRAAKRRHHSLSFWVERRKRPTQLI